MAGIGKAFGPLVLLLIAAAGAAAQWPFVTDNAEVTDRGCFHLELGSQFDRLQRSALPVRFQNTTHASLSYGIIKNMEVTVTGEFLAMESRERPRVIGGAGDTSVEVKYKALNEKDGSWRPAVAFSTYMQFPTGDKLRGFGSGTVDFGINGILQKRVGQKNFAHVNAGYLFSGSTVEGALGITAVRGHVFTGGASFVRAFTEKLQLGGEVSGAVADNFDIGAGQLQFQAGGNYFVRKNMSLDFGVTAGRFSASPRLGATVGLSIDF